MGYESGTYVADRYRVERELGAGGMGDVFVAHDERLDRRVALKVLSASRIGDALAVTRMIREARATAQLEHDHIVPVYDVGSTGDGGAYIAMQLVKGRSLRAPASEGPMPLHEVRRVVGEVGSALSFAHRAGFVHRDVKPDNVMLREDGKAVVLDFGLARRIEPSVDAATLTAEGALVGTPAYLSPEQARGAEVDGRTDQLALGIMTWELLAGRLPWGETSIPAILASVMADAPPRLEEVVSVPRSVADAVARAVEKDPDARFADIDEMIAALGAGAPWADELALAPTLEAVSARQDRPPPTGRGAAARVALGVAAVATVTTAAYLLTRAPDAETPAAAPDAEVAQPAVVHVNDLPPPAGCSDAAAEHLRIGLDALYGADEGRALDEFERATDADPDCAAAALRHAMSGWVDDYTAHRRASFGRARAGRDRLSERDRALFEANALAFEDPPRREDAARALDSLADAHPRDPELLALAALHGAALIEARRARARAALALDPGYAYGWMVLGSVSEEAGEVDAALEAYGRCVDVAAMGVDCLDMQLLLYARRDRCERAVPVARRMRALAPHSGAARMWMVRTLLCSGEPAERVELELDLTMEVAGEAGTLIAEQAESMLAAHFGRLDEVVTRTAATLERARREGAPNAIIDATWLRVLALEELGRDEEARYAARDFLVSRTSTLGDPNLHAARGYRELVILQRARGVTDEALWARERDGWLAAIADNHQLRPMDRWALAEAAWIDTDAEARPALEAAPGPFPVAGDAPILWLTAGVYLRLERWGEAVEHLERVAHNPMLYHFPILTARARLSLAEALLALDQQDAACAELAFLVERWSVEPIPATARRASELLAARCAE